MLRIASYYSRTHSAFKTCPLVNASIVSGATLSATQLDATSSVSGNFVYKPAAGTVLSPGTATLSLTFTPTDTAAYATATRTVQLVINPAPDFTITAKPATLTIAAGRRDQQSLPLRSSAGLMTLCS